jgi:hypothetical protein
MIFDRGKRDEVRGMMHFNLELDDASLLSLFDEVTSFTLLLLTLLLCFTLLCCVI